VLNADAAARGSEIAKVVTASIHRTIEAHAMSHGDIPAIVDHAQTIGYRALNQRANTLARQMMMAGLRRGGHAVVAMDRGADLAAVLLAVLKAGGCYTFVESAGAQTPQLWIAPEPTADMNAYAPVDLLPLLCRPAQAGPNLPVLVRGSDVACVLRETDGRPGALIPHATIAALQGQRVPRQVTWTGDTSALDLWTGLMAGATIRIPDAASALEAA
jgi:non-ribosomal peptide synthetase component F